MKINYDSQSTIFLTKNPTYHSKTKHIDVKYHFVRHGGKKEGVVGESREFGKHNKIFDQVCE
jgi:hypothetical protein